MIIVKNNSIYKGILIKLLSVYLRASVHIVYYRDSMSSLFLQGFKDRAGDYLQRQLS